MEGMRGAGSRIFFFAPPHPTRGPARARRQGFQPTCTFGYTKLRARTLTDARTLRTLLYNISRDFRKTVA